MQQFTVPQFIDVEDKVIGPLSVRQFIILMVTAIIIALFYRILNLTLFVISGTITLTIGTLFTFVRISGMPFHYFLLNFLITLSRPSLRVWHKWWDIYDGEEMPIFTESPQALPRLYSMSHLNRLSLIVDTKGYYTGVGDENAIIQAQGDRLDMLID